MFHSCGSIVPSLDRLIEIGVDILDPVQVTAANMDPGMLKKRFGPRLCFHGSIDTQRLLPHGTPGEVAATVRRMRAVLGDGGGLILAPSHVFQGDVPTANILALYEGGLCLQRLTEAAIDTNGSKWGPLVRVRHRPTAPEILAGPWLIPLQDRAGPRGLPCPCCGRWRSSTTLTAC